MIDFSANFSISKTGANLLCNRTVLIKELLASASFSLG
jgi:hypothetical protein